MHGLRHGGLDCLQHYLLDTKHYTFWNEGAKRQILVHDTSIKGEESVCALNKYFLMSATDYCTAFACHTLTFGGSFVNK